MTSADSPIDRLRRVALRLTGMNDPDTEWLLSGIRQFEAGARFGTLLDDVLELRSGQGRSSWWEQEAIGLRDDLIRRIAAQYFGSLSQRAAAAAIARKVSLYEMSGWRRHRAFIDPPEAIQGSLRGDLFYLLKTNAPISEAVARRALGAPRARFMSHESGDYVATAEENHGSNHDDENAIDQGPGGSPAEVA